MIKAVTKQILKKESEDGQLRRGGDIFGFCVLAFTYQKWAGVICFDNTE